MMREILQHALENLKIDCGHTEHNQHDIWESATNAYEKRIKELENELTTLEASPWVDVNERPAPSGKMIYIYTDMCEKGEAIYVNGEWEWYPPSEFGDQDVTHWQPLPPAPEQTP